MSNLLKGVKVNLEDSEILELYQYATKNRVGFFFLHLLEKASMLPEELENEYKKLRTKYIKIKEKFIKVSNDLDEIGVDFAIFKSLKPYPTTTVDIDVIIFDDIFKAYRGLRKKGYIVLGYGPESITMSDTDRIVGIDLYNEVAISKFIYLDKDKLRNHVRQVELDDGSIRTLTTTADVLAVIAHALIKEQMITLADYFTVTLQDFNINELIKLAEEHSITRTIHLFLSIIDFIHKTLFNRRIFEVKLNHISRLEISRLTSSNFSLPLKLHPVTTLSLLLERLNDKKFSASIFYQFTYLMNKSHARFFIEQFIHHLTRESY